jgi:hypothetical protein
MSRDNSAIKIFKKGLHLFFLLKQFVIIQPTVKQQRLMMSCFPSFINLANDQFLKLRHRGHLLTLLMNERITMCPIKLNLVRVYQKSGGHDTAV